MRKLLGALSAMTAITLAVAPTASADPPSDVAAVDDYPVAAGRFDSPSDFYWKFFKTPDGRSCGIAPNGQVVGCDAVPVDAPAGTNLTVVRAGQLAIYQHSDTATFTRDVDVLPAGKRLVNWGSSCAVDDQGAVTCQTYGRRGFRISASMGELW